MESPFINDIFAMIYQAFKNLYPDKTCVCCWDEDLGSDNEGNKVYGITNFENDGNITVYVTTELPICDCAEVFAHELAHVAVGHENDHNDIWEKAFDDIFNEYNRMVKQNIK